MGCGSSVPKRPESDADPPVLLEMDKAAGESSGLSLFVGPLGFLRVHSVNPTSCFVGLIEPGDELMEVNGVKVPWF